jgi:hypothetical protein
MQIAGAHCIEDLGMSPGRSRRVNPLVGNPLREVQDALAVAEHRRASLFEIERARFDLAEVCEQLGLDRVTALDQLAYPLEQLGIGESSQCIRHDMTSRDGGVRSKIRIT